MCTWRPEEEDTFYPLTTDSSEDFVPTIHPKYFMKEGDEDDEEEEEGGHTAMATSLPAVKVSAARSASISGRKLQKLQLLVKCFIVILGMLCFFKFSNQKTIVVCNFNTEADSAQ